MYRNLVAGIVAAVVPLLMKDAQHERATLDVAYRNGVLDTVVAVLILPFKKVERAFSGCHKDFVHTKLAEEKIVYALLA